jgi:hypothetical protein
LPEAGGKDQAAEIPQAAMIALRGRVSSGPKRRWNAKFEPNRLSLSSKLRFGQNSCRRAQACRRREPEICMSQPFSGLLQRSPDVRSVRLQTFADLTLDLFVEIATGKV